MADISKIKLPSGDIYDIKDAAVRALIGNHTIQSDVPENAVFTDTTYTATNPISISNTVISHATSGVTAASKGDTTNQTPVWGGTFKALSGTVNATGHLTAFSEHTVTIPSTIATTSANGLMSSQDKVIVNSISSTYATRTESANHVIVSETEPDNQTTGDIWLVIEEDFSVQYAEGVDF